MNIHDLQPGQAVMVDWSAERYHADTDTVSRSMLDVLERSPMEFEARYESRTMAPDAPSDAMELGTNVHLAVLEPEEWRRRLYPPAPARPSGAKGNAKKGTPEKEAYVAWQADCDAWENGQQPDSIVMTEGEIRKIEGMAARFRAHQFASMLLAAPGVNEQTVIWREPETKLLIRARLDRLAWLAGVGTVILDLKTTKDPRPGPFGDSVARYGYHRQGALYHDIVAALPDETEDPHFVFGVVRSAGTYDPGCYELGEGDIEEGRSGRFGYVNLLLELVHRRETRDWLGDWQRGCKTLHLPRWART